MYRVRGQIKRFEQCSSQQRLSVIITEDYKHWPRTTVDTDHCESNVEFYDSLVGELERPLLLNGNPEFVQQMGRNDAVRRARVHQRLDAFEALALRVADLYGYAEYAHAGFI